MDVRCWYMLAGVYDGFIPEGLAGMDSGYERMGLVCDR